MEDLYSIHPAIPRSSSSLNRCFNKNDAHDPESTGPAHFSDLIKAQIASHPRYPSLVSAYIDCRKVGAPPETASILEEIAKENHTSPTSVEIGSDPELDDFMESYYQVLIRYKEELSKPFDEATSFLTKIEMQLTDLCGTTASTSTITTAACNSLSDELGVSSEELGHCETETEASGSQEGCSSLGDQELKQVLLKKYSGYLSSLRKEFLKKKKKEKLPKDSRSMLLDWWNTHYRWPYPTEEEKAKLAETTRLDQKQINNWFINQRKRHWKPSEDTSFAITDDVSGSSGTTLYFDRGTLGP